MLLCPDDHTLIDDLLPDEHPVERLQEMRAKHLSHAAEGWHPSEEDQVRFTIMVIEDSGYWVSSIPGPDIIVSPPSARGVGRAGQPEVVVGDPEGPTEDGTGAVLPLEAKGTLTFGGGGPAPDPSPETPGPVRTLADGAEADDALRSR